MLHTKTCLERRPAEGVFADSAQTDPKNFSGGPWACSSSRIVSLIEPHRAKTIRTLIFCRSIPLKQLSGRLRTFALAVWTWDTLACIAKEIQQYKHVFLTSLFQYDHLPALPENR